MRRHPLPIALLAASAAALFTPAGADGAARHIVRGGGFGHGVGMSQYGAYGLAQHGRDHKQILHHYFRDVKIEQTKRKEVRVLLGAGRGRVEFKGATGHPEGRLNEGHTYVAKPASEGRVKLVRSDGSKLIGVYKSLRVTRGVGIISIAGTGRYRGALELRNQGGGLQLVNAVGIDEYVRGVIPSESPPSWPLEALKAQAVAARSYALASNGLLFTDTRSQVYRGADGEHPRADKAVAESAKQVITHNGQIAQAFFFSSSGGRTEDVENVFYGAPRAYLKSVEDPYDDASPRHRWRFEFSTQQLGARLSGLYKGKFEGVNVVERGSSPRIVWAVVRGSEGKTKVRGATLKARLALYDTWALFTRVESSQANAAGSRSFLGRMARAGESKRPLRLVGAVDPRPRDGRIVLERRRDGQWRRLRRSRLDERGRYDLRVPRPGVYRVRIADGRGPVVRVR